MGTELVTRAGQSLYQVFAFSTFCVFPLCAQHSLHTPLYQENAGNQTSFSNPRNETTHCVFFVSCVFFIFTTHALISFPHFPFPSFPSSEKYSILNDVNFTTNRPTSRRGYQTLICLELKTRISKGKSSLCVKNLENIGIKGDKDRYDAEDIYQYDRYVNFTYAARVFASKPLSKKLLALPFERKIPVLVMEISSVENSLCGFVLVIDMIPGDMTSGGI